MAWPGDRSISPEEAADPTPNAGDDGSDADDEDMAQPADDII